MQESSKNTDIPVPAPFGLSLLTKSGITIAGTTAGAFLSYFFNPLLIAPRIGPEGIAVVGAFLSLFYLFSFPQIPIGNVAVRYLAELKQLHGAQAAAAFLRVLFRRISMFGLLLVIPLFLLSPWIASYLKLQSVWPVAAAIAMAYLCLLVKIGMSGLQALLRFGAISAVTVIDPAVRILAGAALFAAGWHMAGALGAYIIGYAAAGCAAWLLLKDILRHKQIPVPLLRSEVIGYGLPSLLYAVYLAYVQTVDILIAKHYFEPAEAGLYVAVMTLGKIAFLAVTPLASVGFSLMSNAVSSGRKTERLLLFNMLLAGGFSGALALLYVWLPEKILAVTYGAAFSNAEGFLFLGALSLVPLSCLLILANYNLALKRYGFVYALAGMAVIHTLLLMLYHDSPERLLTAHFIGGALEFAAAALATLPLFQSPKKQ